MSDRYKILIVEPDFDTRKNLVASLENQFDIVTARNGMEAINGFKAESPQLILMELDLAVLTGMQVIKKILEQKKGTMIIGLTADPNEKILNEAIKSGAMGVIRKPLNTSVLGKKMIQLLDNMAGRKEDPAVTKMKKEDFLSVEVSKQKNLIIVKLNGVLNQKTTVVLKPELDKAAQQRILSVALNLSGLTKVDASGVGLLVETHKKLSDSKRKLVLYNCTPEIKKQLKEGEIDKDIKIFSDQNELKAAFKKPGMIFPRK